MAEYIEREALIANITKEIETQRERRNVFATVAFAHIKGVVENSPAADVVEVRHGEWFSNGGSFSTPRCSLCNWKKPYTEDYWCGDILYAHWNYCPNCGAKMDGKGEGE